METKYIVIMLILVAVATGLLATVITQARRIRHLVKQMSQNHYEKIKMQLLLERMQKQLAGKETEATNQ